MWWEYLLTFLVGAAIPLIGILIQRRDKNKLFEIERRDKFKLAALDKRLEAHQKAYALCSVMMVVMDSSDEDEVRKVFKDGQKLMSVYSLYLGNGTRNKFVEALGFLNAYCPSEKFISKFDSNENKRNAMETFLKESERIFDLAKVIQEEVALEPISMDFKPEKNKG